MGGGVRSGRRRFRTSRSFQAMPLSIKPHYPGNTHRPADEIGIRHFAIIRGDFLFVDDDEAVAPYTVTISAEVCGRYRTGAKIQKIARAELSLFLIEVDECRFPTAAMPRGA